MWLLFYRYTATLAGVVITLFNLLAQLTGHKRSLTGGALLELNFLGQELNKVIQVVNIHCDAAFCGRIPSGAGVLENILWEVQLFKIDSIKPKFFLQFLLTECADQNRNIVADAIKNSLPLFSA